MQYFSISTNQGEIPLVVEVFEDGLDITLRLVMPHPIEDYSVDYFEGAVFIEIKSEVNDG